MLGKLSCVVIAVLLVCCIAGAALAVDIVTVPTANMLGAGQIDVAAYYISVDQSGLIAPLRPLGIDNVRVQTLYAGLTNRWELDVERFDVDVPDFLNGDQTIVNLNYMVLPESAKDPQVVIGGWDLTQQFGHASWYLCTYKTLNPPVGGPPTGPIFRLHLSVGTATNSIFAEPRHQGLFGGLQVLVKPTYPQVGAVAMWDSQDMITGLTYCPSPDWPTFKGGTYGSHTWFGMSYTFNCPK